MSKYYKTGTDVPFEVLVNTLSILARSKYGQYIILKGGSALMLEAYAVNRADFIRKTRDIDLHMWNGGVWRDLIANGLAVLNNNTCGYYYSNLVETRCNATSAGATLDVTINNITYNIGIDMNLKDNTLISIKFLEQVGLKAYDNYTMLADKISAVSSDVVYRRIRDLFDIWVLSQLDVYESTKILQALERKRPTFFTEGKNMLTPDNLEKLDHAYSKYQGILYKPAFDKLISNDITFLMPIYNRQGGLRWQGRLWEVSSRI